MAFRFIHTADIHLDSPLKSLALRNAELADLIANATRQAFVRIIDLSIEEDVDALVIAGDLYDGDQTSMKTARFFAEQMHRLDAAGIRTFILRGNHDALSKITKELVFPASVTVFSGRAEAVALDRGGALPDIVIHGLSFANPTAPESLLPKYKAPVASALNIGVMHTSLGGAPGHDPYAPCSIADLDDSGFHYWALGHIHKRSVHSGTSTVVMPGNPQGRDINESGPKSVSLVSVSDDKRITVTERNVSVAQFERLTVDLSAVVDWKDAVTKVSQALFEARSGVEAEHLIVRLHLTGDTPLAWSIRRDTDLLHEELSLRGQMAGAVWIEKIELQFAVTTPPSGEAGNTIDELRQLIVEDVSGAAGFRAQAEDFAGELIKALPADLRNLLGRDADERERILAALAIEGAQDVLAQLQGPATAGANV